MISQSEAIITGIHAADWTGKEGHFVETIGGADSIVNAVSDIPLGVILEGMPAGGRSTIATPNYGGVVKVKVTGTSPGTINRGTYVVIKADGTVAQDTGSGARTRVARALQAGAADELIDAYLIEPIYYAS
jgi:hypothetical protein